MVRQREIRTMPTVHECWNKKFDFNIPDKLKNGPNHENVNGPDEAEKIAKEQFEGLKDPFWCLHQSRTNEKNQFLLVKVHNGLEYTFECFEPNNVDLLCSAIESNDILGKPKDLILVELKVPDVIRNYQIIWIYKEEYWPRIETLVK